VLTKGVNAVDGRREVDKGRSSKKTQALSNRRKESVEEAVQKAADHLVERIGRCDVFSGILQTDAVDKIILFAVHFALNQTVYVGFEARKALIEITGEF
jgi:hypothetical protein